MNKQQLASRIWETANSLRGKVKAGQYKDYILGFMFYKYLSDKEEKCIVDDGGSKEDLKGNASEVVSYFQSKIGYYIGYEDLFSTWREMGGKLGANEVQEALKRFNNNIASEYKRLFNGIFSVLEKGLRDLGENGGSRDRAVRDMLDLIADVPTTSNDYDVLGYIYEYLVYKVASINAKEDGAFYTPHEVTSLISRIIAYNMKDRKSLNVYDPTCGSGGLLLNIGKEVGKYIENDYIKYYGQELITETYNLARMNLIMKGISASNICVRNGDTLQDDWPYFDEITNYEPLFVDAVVSNPPYSLKWDSENRNKDPRFNYGVAPSGKADYAFLQHCLYHLRPDGVMGIVLPHGVLFRGDSEGQIRKNLIENNHIETIIGLPGNLFFATGIPTIIMILKKNRSNSDILFIDASQNFTKDKTQNILRESDVRRIYDAVVNRKDIPNYARVVSKDEIISNDYNLNIPRYVSASEQAEEYDLESVMTGNISMIEVGKYDKYWNVFKGLKEDLFDDEEFDYKSFKTDNISDLVNNHSSVKDFRSRFSLKMTDFSNYLVNKLITNISNAQNTKDDVIDYLFDNLSESSIIDIYDLYEVFASKWNMINTDLQEIAGDLSKCKAIVPNMVVKTVRGKKVDVQEGYNGVIFSLDDVKSKFFHTEYEKIKGIEDEISQKQATYNDIFENMDESLKTEVQNKDGSGFDLSALKKYLKGSLDTNSDLIDAKEAMEDEKELVKSIKKIKEELDVKACDKLVALTDDEVKTLLEEKWVNSIIKGMEQVCSNTISDFVKQLDSLRNKYSKPLSEIDKEIEEINKELRGLMSELTGSDADMHAIGLLMGLLEE